MELQKTLSSHHLGVPLSTDTPSPELIQLIKSRPQALEAIYQYDTGASKAERHAALEILYANFSRETTNLILRNKEKLKAIFLQ